jgi:hypothetical protein
MRLPDIFQDQDKPEVQYAQAGLDADAIVETVLTDRILLDRHRHLMGGQHPADQRLVQRLGEAQVGDRGALSARQRCRRGAA